MPSAGRTRPKRPKPYDAMRPATLAPAEHPVRQKRQLPVEDW
jgi:putative transposase